MAMYVIVKPQNKPMKQFSIIMYYVIYTLLDRTRFRARVEVVTSDHNNRMIPIVFSHLVLTKS